MKVKIEVEVDVGYEISNLVGQCEAVEEILSDVVYEDSPKPQALMTTARDAMYRVEGMLRCAKKVEAALDVLTKGKK